MIPNIKKILYVTIGFLIIFSYIWFRFLRERLPRDIPFNLSVFSFFYLISICLLYLYVLYKIYKPSEITFNFNNKFFIFIREILVAFHDVIKNIIKPWVFAFYTLLKNKELYFWQVAFIFCSCLPRILFLIVFFIDVFYFQKLSYIYNIVFIGIFFLLWHYIIYVITVIQDDLIKELEIDIGYIYIPFIPNEQIPENVDKKIKDEQDEDDDEVDDDDDDDPFILDEDTNKMWRGLTVKQFLQYKMKKLYEEFVVIDNYFFTYSDIFCEKMALIHNISSVRIRIYWMLQKNKVLVKILQEPLRNKIDLILNLDSFLEKLIEASKIVTNSKEIKNIFVLIYLNYLIIWLYILVISVPTLNLMDLTMLLEQTYKYVEEPFSNG